MNSIPLAFLESNEDDAEDEVEEGERDGGECEESKEDSGDLLVVA